MKLCNSEYTSKIETQALIASNGPLTLVLLKQINKYIKYTMYTIFIDITSVKDIPCILYKVVPIYEVLSMYKVLPMYKVIPM